MKSTTGDTPLYEALVQYEEAANTVGVLAITESGAYRKLTDAIRGYGDLREARINFQLEAALLGDAHQHWALAVQAVLIAVADGERWQQTFTVPHKRCKQCGEAQRPGDVWTHGGSCNECVATNVEARDQANERHRTLAEMEPQRTDHWATYPALISERPWKPE